MKHINYERKIMLDQLEELGEITKESIKLYKIEDQLSDQEWDDKWDALRKRNSILGEWLSEEKKRIN